jgi:hypothetical protein
MIKNDKKIKLLFCYKETRKKNINQNFINSMVLYTILVIEIAVPKNYIIAIKINKCILGVMNENLMYILLNQYFCLTIIIFNPNQTQNYKNKNPIQFLKIYFFFPSSKVCLNDSRFTLDF